MMEELVTMLLWNVRPNSVSGDISVEVLFGPWKLDLLHLQSGNHLKLL